MVEVKWKSYIPNTQTGDLKITDIKTTDSGEYKQQIRNTRGSSKDLVREERDEFSDHLEET